MSDKRSKSNAIAEALAELAASSGGRLTPEAVIEAARNPESPLHDHFEWDDAKAAIKHRLDQARALIRSVEIKLQIGDVIVKAPQYVRDPEASGQGYATLARLRSNEEIAREAVVAEFVRANAALMRAKAIAAALGMAEKVEELRMPIESFAASLKDQPAATA